MEQWRGELFRSEYLPMVRPFSAVPALLRRIRAAGLKVAVGSSAKTPELKAYLDIAEIAGLVDVVTSSDDVEQSKPDPDVFNVALHKLGIPASDTVVIGDTPYDATAAKRAGIEAIGVLSGGFAESDLRGSGCMAVYPGPAALLACFDQSPLARR